jgi:hypothetical protein
MSHDTSALPPCLRFRGSADRTPCNSGVSVLHQALLARKVNVAAFVEPNGILSWTCDYAI